MKPLFKWVLIISLFLNAVFLAKWLFRSYQHYCSKKNETEQHNTLSYYLKMNEVFEVLPNDSNEIVFIGDSHIMIAKPEELFNNCRIKNRGIAGDVTEGVYKRLNEAIDSKPDKLFIEIGTNDLNGRYTVDSILYYYKKIITDTKQKSPRTKIYVISTFPNHAHVEGGKRKSDNNLQDMNNGLKAMCTEEQLQYINLSSDLSKNGYIVPEYYQRDSIHLSPQGYLMFRDKLKKYVDE